MARAAVSGAVKLRKKLRKFDPELRTELAQALSEGGKELATLIANTAPRDEGRLADAVQSKDDRDGLSTVVGYSAKRGGFKKAWRRGGFESLFQEFGTRNQPAQPFIRPAYRTVLPRILARIDAARNKAIQRILTSTETDK